MPAQQQALPVGSHLQKLHGMTRTFPKAPNKIHNPIAVCLATLIGGPIIGGYLIAANFRSFGKPLKSIITLALTIIVTIIPIVVIHNTLMYNPSKFNFYLLIIILSSALIAYLFAYLFQQSKINSYTQNGDIFFPIGKTILFGLGGLVLNHIIIFSIVVSINIARYNKTAANMSIAASQGGRKYFQHYSPTLLQFRLDL